MEGRETFFPPVHPYSPFSVSRRRKLKSSVLFPAAGFSMLALDIYFQQVIVLLLELFTSGFKRFLSCKIVMCLRSLCCRRSRHYLTINVKKNFQFKTVCNGDTTYITQLTQQKSKRCYYGTLAAHRHNVNVLLSNSTSLMFAVLVV